MSLVLANELTFPLWWSCVITPAGPLVSWAYQFERLDGTREAGIPLFKTADDAGAYTPERPTEFLETHVFQVTDLFELASFMAFLEQQQGRRVFFMHDFQSKDDYRRLDGDEVRRLEELGRGDVEIAEADVERIRTAAWNNLIPPDATPADLSEQQREACHVAVAGLSCAMGVIGHPNQSFRENVVVSYRGTPGQPTQGELEAVQVAFYDKDGIPRDEVDGPETIGQRSVRFTRVVDLGLKLVT